MCLYGLCQSCLILGHRPKDSSSRQGNRTYRRVGPESPRVNLHTPQEGATPLLGVNSVIHFRLMWNLTSNLLSPFYQPESSNKAQPQLSTTAESRTRTAHKCENQLPKFIFLLSSPHSFIYVYIMGSSGNTLQEKVKCQPVSSRQD